MNAPCKIKLILLCLNLPFGFSWVIYKDVTFHKFICKRYHTVIIYLLTYSILGNNQNHHSTTINYYLTIYNSLLIFCRFKRFDNQFIRPYLLKHHQGAEPKILETYSKLAMKDAMDYMRRNASTVGNISGTESMSAIFRNYTAGNLNGRLVLFT